MHFENKLFPGSVVQGWESCRW